MQLREFYQNKIVQPQPAFEMNMMLPQQAPRSKAQVQPSTNHNNGIQYNQRKNDQKDYK